MQYKRNLKSRNYNFNNLKKLEIHPVIKKKIKLQS